MINQNVKENWRNKITESNNELRKMEIKCNFLLNCYFNFKSSKTKREKK